jgi:hypothetical protein
VTATDPAAAARAIAADSATAFQEVFAERFVAAYALGSVAHGGYAPAVSDIDLAIILTDTGDGDRETVAATREPLHPKLSVFWGSLPAMSDGREDGRFPAIDRLDLADHGLLLLGVDVVEQVARPTAEELALESARFAVGLLATDEVIAESHDPRRLLADPVWFTKAVLFPVRLRYSSAMTSGRAATNDEAIAWYLAQPTATAPSLVRLAARVRAGEPLDPDEAAPELAAGLVPIYRAYIKEQARRLLLANAPADLVTAFTHWDQRLSDG